MDKEYGTMFKRLMHERNELRKYIIDICKLLDIDTSQSVLGANCLEFYAVLCSTAKNKISYMEGYIRTVENARDEFAQELKRKKEELQAQRNFTSQEQRKIYCVAYDKTCETGNECKQKKCVFKDRLKYKQALDEIEINISKYQGLTFGKPRTMRENDCIYKILDIINKAKERK